MQQVLPWQVSCAGATNLSCRLATGPVEEKLEQWPPQSTGLQYLPRIASDTG